MKPTTPDAPLAASPEQESPEQALLVRVAARFCHLLRDANRLSWFAKEVRVQVDSLHELLVAATAGGDYALEFTADGVRAEGAELNSPPKAVRQWIQMFRRKGYGGVRFRPGSSPYELVVLCQILQDRGGVAADEDLQKLREIQLVASIPMSSESEVRLQTSLDPPSPRRRRRFVAAAEEDGADLEVRGLVRDLTSAIDEIEPGDEPESSSDRGGGLLEMADQLGHNAEIALILSSLRRHDPYTYDHSINVGLLSICLARYLGWKGRDLEEFGIAALIHDVGKLYTPLEVLNKPGRLTPPEWIVMKRHPRDGYDILQEGGVGSPIAPLIALEHHIGPDGEGYPPLPYGPDRIHPGSQIVRIADIYDAFTTIRPYRSQVRPREVLKMLRKQAGRQLHGEFVEAFCAMMGDFPIGSVVRLASHRIGLVVDVHPEHPSRPLVRLLRDEKGRDVHKMEFVDLRTTDPASGAFVDAVEEAIDPVIRNIPIGRYV